MSIDVRADLSEEVPPTEKKVAYQLQSIIMMALWLARVFRYDLMFACCALVASGGPALPPSMPEAIQPAAPRATRAAQM